MKKTKIDLKIPLFFIWPLGAFLASFTSIASRKSQIIYVLFVTLFGYSFAFTETTADSYRVALVFNEFDYRNISVIFNEYLSGYQTDLYRFSIYSVVKSFTNNPKILFASLGFVFGIFSYKSLKLFLQVKGLEKSFSIFILCVIFFSLNSIANINGARFYTAAIICLCSIINLMYYNNNRLWLLGLLSTFLFHFSFLIIIPFLLMMYLFRKLLFKADQTSPWIFTIFVLTFLCSFILESNIINLSSLSSFLFPSLASKLELYNSSELAEVYEERGKSLFHTVATTFNYVARFYIFILILKIKKTLKNATDENPELQQLFNFLLLFFSITFMLTLFPSGGRFMTISTQIFFFFLIRFYVKFKSNELQKYILGLVPVYLFLVLFSVLYLSSLLTEGVLWYGNLFWIIYEGIGYEFIYV
ncbi:EpsG family protein [Patiriisocius marinus]|uniref:EpsG family protein n=1 Tax=Patiriisocius marinus TaxID=1397112 RepID=UPI00232C945A|nr:EpsG family protein [Patiriisocius marinus]